MNLSTHHGLLNFSSLIEQLTLLSSPFTFFLYFSDLLRYAAVGVAAGTAAVVAAPLVLGAAGFAGAGVAAGSIAAATVKTGGLFAMAAGNAAIGGITGGIAALGAKMFVCLIPFCLEMIQYLQCKDMRLSIVMFLDTGVTRRIATGKEISVFDHLCPASKFLVLATFTENEFFSGTFNGSFLNIQRASSLF